MARQLAETYGADITVKAPRVQQQEGSSDCGLFALAFAVEIAFNGLQTGIQSNFDQTRMREHFEKGLTEKVFQPFPKEPVDSTNNFSEDFMVFVIREELKKKKRSGQKKKESSAKKMKIEEEHDTVCTQ